MTVLDRKASQTPLPERLSKLRARIRQQMPRALWLGRIGAFICTLLSAGLFVAIIYGFQGLLKQGLSQPGFLALILVILGFQLLLSVAAFVSSLGILLSLQHLYPYYYCQMLRGIHCSDFALLLASEDIQREMDTAWRERAFGMPLRPKLITMERHLESSALFFEALYLYSRHQKWMAAMGRFRNPSRQMSVEALFRWSWATGGLLLLVLLTGGVILLHLSIIYAAVSPQHMTASARLAAFLDNYFDTPVIDAASLPELERDSNYFRRLLSPLRVKLPRVPY